MKTVLLLDITQIGFIVAIFPITAAVGSLTGGAIADKWSRKGTLFVFIGMSILLTVLLVFTDTWLILAIVYGLIGFFQGGLMTAKCTIFMDITNPQAGATQFSLLTSLGNAGMTGGETVSGTLVSIFGFGRTFFYSAWIFGPALIFLYFIRFKK